MTYEIFYIIFIRHEKLVKNINFLFRFFQDFQRSRAFLYLNEIKRRFQATYGEGALTALPYAMNTEFSSVLANEMVR